MTNVRNLIKQYDLISQVGTSKAQEKNLSTPFQIRKKNQPLPNSAKQVQSPVVFTPSTDDYYSKKYIEVSEEFPSNYLNVTLKVTWIKSLELEKSSVTSLSNATSGFKVRSDMKIGQIITTITDDINHKDFYWSFEASAGTIMRYNSYLSEPLLDTLHCGTLSVGTESQLCKYISKCPTVPLMSRVGFFSVNKEEILNQNEEIIRDFVSTRQRRN